MSNRYSALFVVQPSGLIGQSGSASPKPPATEVEQSKEYTFAWDGAKRQYTRIDPTLASDTGILFSDKPSPTHPTYVDFVRSEEIAVLNRLRDKAPKTRETLELPSEDEWSANQKKSQPAAVKSSEQPKTVNVGGKKISRNGLSAGAGAAVGFMVGGPVGAGIGALVGWGASHFWPASK